MFRGSFSAKIACVGFRVVVVDRWLLFGGGRYSKVVVNTGLTVQSIGAATLTLSHEYFVATRFENHCTTTYIIMVAPKYNKYLSIFN